MKPKLNIIISGGGTGGHIFPALAIADEFKKRFASEVDILFVGAQGKMEMTKVPAHGYPIIGLDIRGIQRKLTIDNLWVPFRLVASLWKSISILKKQKPDAVIGVGGYASGPLLQAAKWLGYPYFIQEQNSYPGITNKILASRANKIFTAYSSMESFFPTDKIILSGNPVRKTILDIQNTPSNHAFFNLDPSKKTILIVGGSLGALTMNESVYLCIDRLLEQNIQLIWQTGKSYAEKAKLAHADKKGVCILSFIENMNDAYATADIIVSRAGALSISELCIVAKPVIFIPSPNVSEDHQTKNAMHLVKKEAAILLKDSEARTQFFNVIEQLLIDPEKQKKLSENICKLAKPKASEDIVNQILKEIHREV